MRYCPKDLEGASWMLGFSAFNLARFAVDLLGSARYEHSGFGPCVMISTAATILMFTMIRSTPRRAIALKEGHA
jgi:hypothetical protein